VEKAPPTYDLDALKAAIGSAETLAITRSAFSDALSLGFNRAAIATAIQGIRRPMCKRGKTTGTQVQHILTLNAEMAETCHRFDVMGRNYC
jgi:hypothetical protein